MLPMHWTGAQAQDCVDSLPTYASTLKAKLYSATVTPRRALDYALDAAVRVQAVRRVQADAAANLLQMVQRFAECPTEALQAAVVSALYVHEAELLELATLPVHWTAVCAMRIYPVSELDLCLELDRTHVPWWRAAQYAGAYASNALDFHAKMQRTSKERYYL